MQQSHLKLKNEEADKQSILLSEKISRMEKQNNSGVPKNKDFNSDLQNMELNQTISSDSLNDFQKGVWTDPETGLMWSRISIGQQWVDGKCKGIATHVDWKQAEELCKEMRLGKFYDWRLPTINELHTLMIKDRKGYTANTNLLFQPNIGIWGFYWSSKQIMPKVAQGVDFDTGCIAKCNYFDFRGYVRAVRKSCEASK
ncbi:DUF1566 domain-containing protein [Acinetobacter sp.]|uniref:Lcl C-terminal domain-containing protein n=1 Tax=Acinetobacter sp. TaxID=472 RepID=UPI00389077C0